MELNREQIEAVQNSHWLVRDYIRNLLEKVETLEKDAMDNEGLHRQFRAIDIECCRLEKRNDELTEEIEMLKAEVSVKKKLLDKCEERFSSIKADTVNKMYIEIKERCIKGGIYPAFVARTIAEVAKEMLEEGK